MQACINQNNFSSLEVNEMTIDKFILNLDKEIEDLICNLCIKNLKIYIVQECEDDINNIIRSQYRKYKSKNRFLPNFGFVSLLYDYERKVKNYIEKYSIHENEIQNYFFSKIKTIKIFNDNYILFEVFFKLDGEIIRI